MIQNLNGKNSAKYKTVFLDLDGTVAKSGTGCVNGIRYMFEKIGYNENNEDNINSFLGPSVKRHLKEKYLFSDGQAEQAYVFYKEYYISKGIYESCLYDGIKQTIKAIKSTGKTVYIATLKPQDQAEILLNWLGISDLFSGVFGARHDLGISHKNDILKLALDALGEVMPAVMVGDRYYDILSGQHVGLDTVGVLYGYGNYTELKDAGCDYLADSPDDLYTMLGRNDI